MFRVDQVAATDSTVLLYGETGTGKELLARAIHRAARGATDRSSRQLRGAARTLIESELFGHERGAFTGAVAPPRRAGSSSRTAAPSSSTRSARLPLELQAKLLRVLQEGQVERWAARGPSRSTSA